MPSDKKSKDKIKKRSSLSNSDDEVQPKKRKTSDDYGEGGSKKRDKKKDKSHHSKSHKHSKRHSDKEKNSEKKHKTEGSIGPHSKSDFKELSNDDYFAKNNEFSTWLKEEKRKFFSDLTSDSSRELFSEFVKAWNSKKLESKYYEGIETAPRSSHKWKIKN